MFSHVLCLACSRCEGNNTAACTEIACGEYPAVCVWSYSFITSYTIILYIAIAKIIHVTCHGEICYNMYVTNITRSCVIWHH